MVIMIIEIILAILGLLMFISGAYLLYRVDQAKTDMEIVLLDFCNVVDDYRVELFDVMDRLEK